MRLFYTSMSSSEIYPHSLHDALPISAQSVLALVYLALIGSVLGFLLYFWLVTKIDVTKSMLISLVIPVTALLRSEEHTSELQSLRHLVCRLLLEKKKQHARQYWLVTN